MVLRKVLWALIVLLLSLVAISFLLPSRMQVERSILIDQPVERVFSLLNGFVDYSRWSPWHDPSVEYQLSGPRSGVGARLDWNSQTRGDGRLEITESRRNEKISMRMEFFDRGRIDSHFLFSPQANKTRLRWQYDSDLNAIENPFYRYAARYMALLMDGWIAQDYERGLENIRRLLESDSVDFGAG